MKRLKAAYRRILGRLAWAMLRAAEFDVIAQDLMQACETYADPAAVIPRKLAELAGRDMLLDTKIQRLEGAVGVLRAQLEQLREAPVGCEYCD